VLQPPDNLILLPFGKNNPHPEPIAPSEPADTDNKGASAPVDSELLPAIESVLFAADEPLSLKEIGRILGDVNVDLVKTAVNTLIEAMERRGSGLMLVEVGAGWQLRTQRRYSQWVSRITEVKPLRLSTAAIETLSIIAYRQPTIRNDIESLRGVDCGGMVRNLIQRGLVKSVGRSEGLGRPLLYGTTPYFLEFFGLRDLSDLPALRDLRELEEDEAGDIGPLFD
jgi:segregation and condensation protein B